MAGGANPATEAQFKGFSKYYNTTTDLGRTNIAKSTYVGFLILGLYLYLKPKAKAPAKNVSVKE